MTYRISCLLVSCLLVSAAGWGQLRVPNRPSKPLFEGSQGKQKTEILFDPASHTVTLKLLVQDPNGYFIPNIKPENFAVYEDGVRQTVKSVDIEHTPVALALLLENGGRFPSVNRELLREMSWAGHELLRALADPDQIAVWMYAERVRQLADFAKGRAALENILDELKPPDVSETNLYDAVVAMTGVAYPAGRRPAVVVVTSCLDTFSKTKYEDALAAAGRSPAPIYAVSLAPQLRLTAESEASPAAHLNWDDAQHKLQAIVRASGGRLYAFQTLVGITGAYDDMMENLKVRYVITYRSSSTAPPDVPRTVRVELVNPATGKPLAIAAENGTPVRGMVTLRETYTPANASSGTQ